MKVRTLTVGLFATLAFALSFGSTQRVWAQSTRTFPDQLDATMGHLKEAHKHSAPVGSPNAAIVTEDGPLKGMETSATDVFLGIPYAKPPIGNLRWMPPQPHGKWKGVFRATQFGNFCTQPDGSGGTLGNEDCLTLNVFRPIQKKNQNKKHLLPVMVWIHGGGLVTGGSFIYDPTPLVLRGGLIVVTINYRLGFLGFFAHPAIDDEGHTNGDYGYMDQQLALRWVQDNIAAFGGDPHHVTIFGQSAGGQSIYSNMASPTAAGLFQQAISESGAYLEAQDYFDFIVPLATGETTGTRLVPSGTTVATIVGCGSSQTAECLRAVPASSLALAEPGTIFPFVDGTILTQTPSAAFASGQFNRVPVISGGNHDEWRIFVAQTYDFAGSPLTDAGYPAAVATLLMDPLLAAFVLPSYPLINYPPPPPPFLPASAPLAVGALGTDDIFACPERNIVRLLSNSVTVYAYEFNDEGAPPDFADPLATFPLGAYHAAEIQYLFNINQRFFGFNPFTPDQQQLSNTMIGYWTQFANTGDPNFTGAPTWSPYDPGTDQFQSLVPPTPEVESNYDTGHQCSTLWNTF
jgi:para-nitrobenzyl esterase